MISDRHDTAELVTAFRRDGRVQVRDFLKADVASKIEQTLLQKIEWRLALNLNGADRIFSEREWSELPPPEKQNISRQTSEASRNGFQYLFGYYQMRTAYYERWQPPTYLNGVVEFLNSESFLGFARGLSGINDIASVDCQATCFRPGHYLMEHDDTQVASRRLAYVLNFTRAWRPDWGGILQFFDSQGNVAEGYLPAFNVLNVFKVPSRHAVSFVPPFVSMPRLAITGWLHDKVLL